jgi:N-acetylglucosaminyldiphosphoundecaprenol N-acetyl-beta-D-mannosaminyltransferase
VVHRNVIGTRSAAFRVEHGVRSIDLLGVRIDAVRLSELLHLVAEAVRERRPIEVFYANAHTVNLAAHRPDFEALLASADLVYCDGTGVRLGARLLGDDLPQRMTGADWIHDLCRMALRTNLSLFFLGSEPGVAEGAAALLCVRYPGLRIVGVLSGYDTSASTIAAINEAQPDVVLVGMGSPTQERWIAEHRDALDAPVLWAVGALFAFASGNLPRGPRWMTEHGLEWLCRLAVEPGKLWRRYLFGNPLFLTRIVRERLRR